MVMLLDKDVQTKEVLEWKGLHLFHFQGSTCSQKTRIFLRLKGIEWTSHHIDLARKEHLKPWFMGINPRGLVPVLIDNGKVIIESNDILNYLEERFPNPPLMPPEKAAETRAMLKAEDDLHFDIRALTMRFVIPSFLAKRPASDIESYEQLGTGTVGGKVDPNRENEVKFWSDMNEHGGISDERAKRAFGRFREQLDEYDNVLSDQDYLLGEKISQIDIAWYIYARRLVDAGYPFAKLHPAVGRWLDKLNADPRFRDEVPSGGLLGAVTSLLHFIQGIKGTRLVDVVALGV
ncbi:MAG: hypothetical protein Pars2KO_33090 [Parasphingorhabdus sp.]